MRKEAGSNPEIPASASPAVPVQSSLEPTASHPSHILDIGRVTDVDVVVVCSATMSPADDATASGRWLILAVLLMPFMPSMSFMPVETETARATQMRPRPKAETSAAHTASRALWALLVLGSAGTARGYLAP